MKVASARRSGTLWSIVKITTVATYASLILLPIMLPSGPRLVWTVAIALLPLLIVLIGYHGWRDICPLAFFAKLGRSIKEDDRRHIHPWFEAYHHNVQFGLMLAALAGRHLFTNGAPYYLSGFFFGAAVIAFLVGIRYTGKTWCNFICPVGLVEKIYCAPKSLIEQSNSVCQPCTGCKKVCPDVSLKNNYWQDINNQLKQIATYAFPGLVVGFYAYYYLYSGTWSYYFSGAWTREFDLADRLNSPGWFFLHSITKWAAAPVTLIFFSLASCVAFKTTELAIRWCRSNKDTAVMLVFQHRLQVLASFCAFNLFYMFAGAPTFAQIPLFYLCFKIIVLVVSINMLLKGLRAMNPQIVQRSRGTATRILVTLERPTRQGQQMQLTHLPPVTASSVASS